nr:hypothetical protein [Streptomyces atriruber]
MVLGPSGSGKSFLLRAGLVPWLRNTEDPGLRPATIRILTPGPRPVRDHRKLFTPAEGPGDTWLVVDQFEEVFTLCHDAEQQREFVGLVLSAQEPRSRLRVVVGMRADFYARCLEHEGLARVLGEASLPVGPMTPDELREVIVKPAAAAGLIVERALTARLVVEVHGAPGALPLLSHTLLETWLRRRGRTLTVQGYEAAGGVHGAIAQTAEDFYTRLAPDRAETARHILLRLITPGDGAPDTRRPIGRGELATTRCAVRDAGPETVLHELARARLVTLDDDTVDLAHEALITSWPRLRRWLEDDRERLRRHRRLTSASHNWHERNRDSGGAAARHRTRRGPGRLFHPRAAHRTDRAGSRFPQSVDPRETPAHPPRPSGHLGPQRAAGAGARRNRRRRPEDDRGRHAAASGGLP